MGAIVHWKTLQSQGWTVSNTQTKFSKPKLIPCSVSLSSSAVSPPCGTSQYLQARYKTQAMHLKWWLCLTCHIFLLIYIYAVGCRWRLLFICFWITIAFNIPPAITVSAAVMYSSGATKKLYTEHRVKFYIFCCVAPWHISLIKQNSTWEHYTVQFIIGQCFVQLSLEAKNK